jgi:hypothetical protein
LINRQIDFLFSNGHTIQNLDRILEQRTIKKSIEMFQNVGNNCPNFECCWFSNGKWSGYQTQVEYLNIPRPYCFGTFQIRTSLVIMAKIHQALPSQFSLPAELFIVKLAFKD